MAEPTLATATKDPADPMARQENTEPTLSTDPTDPTLRADPTEPMLSAQPTESMLSTDPWLRMDRTERDRGPTVAGVTEVGMRSSSHHGGGGLAAGSYPDLMQWLARGEQDIPDGTQWLTETEAARAGTMRYTKRRTEYLLRRFAGKSAVATTLGLPRDPGGLGRIGVLNRITGAPYVQVDGQALGLDISLTDRAGWAVCLVGPDLGAVGVDLEIVEPRSAGFVSDFLTPGEQQTVAAAAAAGPDGHDAAANLIWSAKESALKVLRTGLRADTRTVEVVPDDVGAIVAPGASPHPGGWQRLTVESRTRTFPGWWRRDGVFLLTVVAAAGLAEPPTELPGSADLATADPIHSWLAHPLVD